MIRRIAWDLLKPLVRPFYRRIYVGYRQRLLEFLVKDTNQAVTSGPLTWDYHGIAARTAIDWLHDQRFAAAHDRAWKELESLNLVFTKRPGLSMPITRNYFHNEWNIHVACWAAAHAVRLEGDFVECGVGAGIFSRVIMEFLNFPQYSSKTFWLVDRWSSQSLDHLQTESEKGKIIIANFIDDISIAKKLFSPYPNVKLIQGVIPDCLGNVTASSIAYLYLDLNVVEPEIAAAEFFWEKLVPGGFVILDDFGFGGHEEQKNGFIKFAKEKHVEILFCPTGQGLMIKAPA